MKIKLLTIAIVTLAFLVSCDKHDGMDDSVIVGPMAPQVYWELGSSTAKAGGDVDFKVQYYTSNEEAQIDHLEVWYNVVITETRQVSCPLLSTFSYTISKTIEEEIRIAQLISSYEHKEEYWNDTLRAYVIEDGFPTSSTLNSVSWVEPDTYDDKKMKTYFGYVELLMGFATHKVQAENENEAWNKMVEWAESRNAIISTLEVGEL